MNSDDKNKLTFRQMLQSILAGALGVQSGAKASFCACSLACKAVNGSTA